PQGIDLSKETPKVRSSIIEGIRNQEMMGELYPVGGAADRLGLKDEKTEENLPAARLIFLGKGLLEGVITDLEAREYLFYRLFGKQIFTPIGLMTSHVNQNNMQIQRICEQSGWFGRPKDSLRFFSQPSVPTFTRDGKWCLAAPLKLLLKPGGHGVMWKLAQKEGVIDWFKEKKRSRVLVRQINNPMAGIDYGLLAFLGVGHEGDKSFGFASCPRRINAQEGMNVLKLTSSETGRRALLTNIEYCDFKRFGIKDQPQKGEENFSQFPSNTNILFANLSFIQKAVKKSPYPGLLLNFREATCYDVEEGEKEREVARLESTMQNITDALPVDI
ncbi:MAG: UTP--glucose-1-phosphate uridylyltransferase, partial [Simkania negevensis]|nr:UTP--glucose-1-phosphate uridylyltransferase [Simkania negevensis]